MELLIKILQNDGISIMEMISKGFYGTFNKNPPKVSEILSSEGFGITANPMLPEI